MMQQSRTRLDVPIKYVIVSPVRDEEEFIGETFQSIISQTIQPAEWIIVDDGSHDSTGRIIDEYAARYPWIVGVHRADRGRRLAGTGVMEAFYSGYERLRCKDWEFIVKLDGDVGLERYYFERCFERFREDPKLGICGGVMYAMCDGQLRLEQHPMFHVRGPIKLYRRSCWDVIGGLIRSPGWDTVDEVHANMLGWCTKSLSDLKVIHHRPTGAAAGAWRDNFKNGRADYVSGYHPLFIAVKCVSRLFKKPYLLKSVAHAYGYLSGYTSGFPRVQNEALIRYVRAQQIRRLLFMRTIWR